MYRCRLSHGIHRLAFSRTGIPAYRPGMCRCRHSRNSLVGIQQTRHGPVPRFTDTACTDSGTLVLFAGIQDLAYTGSPNPGYLPGTPAYLPALASRPITDRFRHTRAICRHSGPGIYRFSYPALRHIYRHSAWTGYQIHRHGDEQRYALCTSIRIFQLIALIAFVIVLFQRLSSLFALAPYISSHLHFLRSILGLLSF
jgi:hypothetical protein